MTICLQHHCIFFVRATEQQRGLETKWFCVFNLGGSLSTQAAIVKGTQVWNFFLTFFAETETIWSQGPITWDFWKLYSIRPRYSTFKHFRACSACDEIRSAYAQCAIKFVPRMLSMYCTCKTVHILQLAEHARKFVPRMLWNWFRVCWACDKIVSAYAQHTHAIIFEKYSKISN